MGKKIKLEDGREIEHTAGGRWRDTATGRFVPKANAPENREYERRDAALLRDIVGVVRQAGYPVESLNDAWEVILGVQAEIALDKQGGTKATSAAKFLRDALLPEEGQEDDPELILGKQLAADVLALIASESGGEGRNADGS